MRKLNVFLAALVLVLAGVLIGATTASAKHAPRAAATSSLTATYDSSTQHLSIAGCGYDITAFPSGVQVVYTHPDSTTETWYMGITWSDGGQCLDTNYILASAPGTWTIQTFQAGLPVASTTVDIS